MQRRLQRLAQASLIVLGGFAVSRVLGLVRNIVILNFFGTTREYEAFVAALQIPDLIFQVLAGGAVAAAFIPVFKRYSGIADDQAWRVTSSAINLAVLATGFTALVLFFLAGLVVRVLVPGWDAPSQELTASLMRVMLLSPVIFAASAFATSILNSYHRFALAALAPLTHNLSIIIGTLLLHERLGIFGLAIAVVAGAALHLVVQLPGLVRVGMRYRPVLDTAHEGVRSIIGLMLPRMLGLGVAQLNLLVNVVLASFLLAGSVGYLYVAWLMLLSPLAVAMAISTAVFPSMAEAGARAQGEQLRQVFYISLRSILFISIPASIGLMVLAEPIIRLFFERGEFTAESTQRTAYALTFFAVGLAGHGVVEIADRLFYALADTRTPVMIAIVAFGVNLSLSLVLMQTPLNYGGLALANAIAAIVEATILVRLLKRKVPNIRLQEIAVGIVRLGTASLLMGMLVLYLTRASALLVPQPGLLAQAAILGGLVLLGSSFYVGITALMRCEELRVMRAVLRPE